MEFTIKETGLGEHGGYAAWRVSHGDHWAELTVTNNEAAHDFPDGTTKFVLEVQMEGEAGGTAEATMVQKTTNGDKEVKPAFKRKLTRAEAASGVTVRDFQVEKL
ncbi:MAG: hypothetical protein QM608_15240 [Caulobacter sp.]